MDDYFWQFVTFTGVGFIAELWFKSKMLKFWSNETGIASLKRMLILISFRSDMCVKRNVMIVRALSTTQC